MRIPVRELLLGTLIGTPFLVGATVAQSEGPVAADPDAPSITVRDPEIIESSGLVVRSDRAVTVNDSGDTARVFTVDLATGETVGVTHWSAEPEDLEALAPAGPGEVWAGDIGDNPRERSAITVARVPVGPGDRSVDAPSYELTYPDGARDAETLLSDPVTGRLYVVSKDSMRGTVYAAPAQLKAGADNRMEALGSVLGLATDGAFFPDGKHIVVRNYTSASVYSFPELSLRGSWMLPSQRQGEGIAVAADGSIYLSSEGIRQELLHVAVPAKVRAAMEGGAEPSTPPSVAPSTSSSSAGTAVPEVQAGERTSEQPGDPSRWPWVLGGFAGLAALVALFRSLRPR
jgi:hypothetical protein